jgi:amino acid permease
MYYKYFSMMQVYTINVVKPPTPDANWVTGLATIFMAYGCHPVFFYLRSELISKTEKRVQKVIGTAIGTECVLYLIISIAGYVSLGDSMTPGIFTLREAIRKR